MHLYIFGNGNLSFDDFLAYYRGPLSKLDYGSGVRCIVCDFRGTDTLATLLRADIDTASVTISEVTPTPVPPALPLMAAGLAILGLLSRRRA